MLTQSYVHGASERPLIGDTIEFGITVGNVYSQTARIVRVVDFYPPSCLDYLSASVPASQVDTGQAKVTWSDLTTTFGDLAPGEILELLVQSPAVERVPQFLSIKADPSCIEALEDLELHVGV